MSAVVEDPDRRIIPRWRDSLTTVATGELTPLESTTSPTGPVEDFLAAKIEDWHASKSIAFASDLVSAAFVLGREKDVAEAAEFLLGHSNAASSSAVRIAKRVLKLPGASFPNAESEWEEEQNPEASRAAIRRLRSRLREEPRNALAWIDLARQYATLGLNEQSIHSMGIGVSLAPENRFALRSAARLYVHVGDLDRAYSLLRRSDTAKHDPWLMAAEIAVATVAERSSRLVKRAKSILDSDSFAPSQTSELASAVATVELVGGKSKAARKMFNVALLEPNDNSVAQAEWASRRLPHFEIEQRHLEIPRSFEARAWEFYSTGDWKRAVQESWRWLNDEPFSSRPAVHGSFISSVALEDYSSGARFARRGLIANPKDQTLLNNLAFSLASSGSVEEATRVYDEMMPTLLDRSTRVPWLATGGLLKFRRGLHDEGRALYLQAIDLARSISEEYRAVLAAAFLAREELIAKTPNAPEALKVVLHAARKQREPILHAVLERLVGLHAARD